jgi:prolyl-tRNA synthetase
MEGEKADKGIKFKKSENFSEWYTDVIIRSEFVDYSSVSGMMVLRPDSYFLWEQIMNVTDRLLKENGVTNTAFPILIPERLLQKEAKHIEHFKAEVAWVTHGGDSELEERLAIRPTSETIMYESVAKWVRSWRDLPMKLNQWNSVVRWEFKHPTPFLRTREFHWNEGHSIYATEEETIRERDVILGIYEHVLKDYLALPCIVGRKTEQEKFAGGVASYSIEQLMPDGWAIQGPDWHFDGQNFAKVFNIEFLDKDGKKALAWQSTYAISTRVLGALIATHGDDRGLVIPPMMSRIQVVVVPIYKTDNRDKVIKAAMVVASEIGKKSRVHLDDRDDVSPGWKFNEWELKGVPLRIEIGERDINEGKVVAARRDTLEKTDIKIDAVGKESQKLLKNIQKSMYKRAVNLMKSMRSTAYSYASMKSALEVKKGFVLAPWCGSDECENKIKEETGAKITNMPLDQQNKLKGNCIYCGKQAKHMANFAKSY